MLSRFRSGQAWLLLGLLLIGLLFSVPAVAIETGAAPPDFKLTGLDGKEVRLSDFKGKVVILKLATTWCPSCKQQVRELAKLEEFLARNEIALIEVFVDEPEEAVREYLQERSFNVPHVALLDDGQVARAYRIYTIPRVLLIDRDFKVQRDRGLIVAADLEQTLQEMLE